MVLRPLNEGALIRLMNSILVLFLQFLPKIHSDSAQNRIDLLPTFRSIPQMKNFRIKSSQKSFKVTKKFKTYTYRFIVQLINYPQSVHNMYECDKRFSLKHISVQHLSFIFSYQIQ